MCRFTRTETGKHSDVHLMKVVTAANIFQSNNKQVSAGNKINIIIDFESWPYFLNTYLKE